jgi:hypothetical protein
MADEAHNPWPELAIKFWYLKLFPIKSGHVKEVGCTLFVLLVMGQMYCCCVAISFSAFP